MPWAAMAVRYLVSHLGITAMLTTGWRRVVKQTLSPSGIYLTSSPWWAPSPLLGAEGPRTGAVLAAAGVDSDGIAVTAHIQVDHAAHLTLAAILKQFGTAVAGFLAIEKGDRGRYLALL